jgi:hypothetical protein
VRLDRIGECAVDLVYRFFQSHAVVGVEGGIPIPVLADFTVFVPHIVGWRQAVDIFEKCLAGDRVLERKVAVQSLLVELAGKAGMFEYALDFGRKYYLPVRKQCVVHRLYTKIIAGDEKRMVGAVPYCKGKHAAQLCQKPLAPLLKTVQQHLAVSFGCKGCERYFCLQERP